MNLPVAPLAGVVLGAAAAAAVVAVPVPMLEQLVSQSGIPAIVTAAAPPLGLTARLAMAGGAGAVAALLSWFALFLLLGTRGLTIGRAAEPDVPVIRRADAHPDAPPRAPLLATRDLGTPFLEVKAPSAETPVIQPDPLFTPVHVAVDDEPAGEATPPTEQPLPVDLDQPLSAFDPAAIPDAPLPPPVQLPPLRRAARPAVFDASERFETFELTPIRRAAEVSQPRAPQSAPNRAETEATIHALLERLERGVVRRGLAAAPTKRESERGLEEALVTLRNLARRAS